MGGLTLSDSRGRIIDKVSTDEMQDGSFIIGELSFGEGKSLYSKMGNPYGIWSYQSLQQPCAYCDLFLQISQ
ncbi:MAG: hypothetical protein H6Q68_2879 [Firmicutes bacterium]|nr:hypothetical protein [Bacillota bacterium]